MKQKLIITTKIAMSNKELNCLDSFNINHSLETPVFFSEPIKTKGRIGLDEDVIKEVRDKVKLLKAKHPTKKIIQFFQFTKNGVKSLEEIELATRCNIFEGSDGVCLYETNPEQSPDDFSKQVDILLEVSGDAEKYFVLEMSSIDVGEKLDIILGKGIKNIILMSGEYQNKDLWIDLTMKIRKEQGTSIVVCRQRMHKTTKLSYMKYAIDVGSDFVVHGYLSGRENKNKTRINLFLDYKDMTYKPKKDLSTNSFLLEDENVVTISNVLTENSEREYELSRVCAIVDGQSFCNSHKRTIILEA